MGKTSKPLKLLVHPDLAKLPEIRALIDQGHTVEQVPALMEYDGVVGPNCWRMERGMLKYIPIMLKAIRRIRYPTREEKP